MAYPHSGILFALVIVVEVLSSIGQSTSQSINQRAAYYNTTDGFGITSGACGYGDYGRDILGGNVAAASQLLYRNGAGCGACYQVKCKNKDLCTDSEVTIVVTDHGDGDHTDFILSPQAFKSMAKKGNDTQLQLLGVVDIEYKRVACNYPGHNIEFKIHNSTNYPYYLALVLVNLGGDKDVVAVDISEEKTYDWKTMRRGFGAVWDIVMTPPKGNLALRFQLSGGEVIDAQNLIPSNWKAGVVFDTGVQVE